VPDVPLRTPDKRYIVARGRLWRATNPNLGKRKREALTKRLMDARRAVAAALRAKDSRKLALARASVQAAKVGLGERGPVWWDDGVRDYNRFLVKNTPYGEWFERVVSRSKANRVKL
jgi:hypothetical protein